MTAHHQPPPPPAVTFWGAAQSVTGSMHLVEAAGRRVLLDCGLVRTHRGRPPDDHTPCPPTTIDAVVLSHAHIDHCGNLPWLIRAGFTGPIYCTPATRDLVGLMLAGSARFHEEEAFVRRVVGRPGDHDAQPHFSRADVDQAVRQCVAVPCGREQAVSDGIRLRFLDAGHILGSAITVLTVTAAEREQVIVFTGDLGRRESLLLQGPAPLPAADLLICESTYGSRSVAPVADAVSALEDVVRRAVANQGKVLIPTFSLGRMQVVAYALREALRTGRVPPLPVYVDSPLAADIAALHGRHADALRSELASRYAAGEAPLDGAEVRYVRAAEESEAVSQEPGPAVLLAPGGMCEGGRIVQHLKRHIDDPRCSVVLVNYQAPHTPGRRLLERGPTVKLHGRKWNKWAEVVYLPGFSGHADRDDLLACLGPLADRAARVRLVHGELEEAESLANALRARGFPDVAVPGRGQTTLLA